MSLRSILKSIAILSFMVLMTGCAVNRSVVPVKVAEPIANPVNGIDVKIVSVVDMRKFELDPKTPNIPSISKSEVNNAGIHARAIARKRNTYGAALGDVLLPEGQTVVSLMKTSISNSFRLAGYRVLSPTDPKYETAVPINVELNKFWSWVEWGFWNLKLHNNSEVKIVGPVPNLENGKVITNAHIGSHSAVFESDWQDSASFGIEGLSAKVIQELK